MGERTKAKKDLSKPLPFVGFIKKGQQQNLCHISNMD